VHERGDAHVKQKSAINTAGSHRQGAKHHAGDDRTVSLEVWLSVVDHTVRQGHRKNGAGPHRVTHGPDHPPSKEELEREKLREIHRLPRQEVEPTAGGKLVKRVVATKVGLVRNNENHRTD